MPDASNVTFTLNSASVLLFTTALNTTSSPTEKKRGACKRTMSGCFVRVVALAMPNCAPLPTARAVVFQPVSESGYFTGTRAVPSAPVFTSGSQRMVERKSVRTTTFGSSSPGAPNCFSPFPFSSRRESAIANFAADIGAPGAIDSAGEAANAAPRSIRFAFPPNPPAACSISKPSFISPALRSSCSPPLSLSNAQFRFFASSRASASLCSSTIFTPSSSHSTSLA